MSEKEIVFYGRNQGKSMTPTQDAPEKDGLVHSARGYAEELRHICAQHELTAYEAGVMHEAQKDLDQLANLYEQLQARVSKLVELADEARRQYSVELKGHDETIDTLREQNQQLESRIEMFIDVQHALREQNAAQAKEIAGLTEQPESWKQQFCTVVDAKQSIVEQLDHWKETAEGLGDQLAKANLKIERLKAEIEGRE